jgi:DNA-binding transcriptional MocR family regulator
VSRTSGEPLSDRQRAVLSLLERYRRENREFPSLSYLARELGVHHSTMQEHLGELHRKRYLRAAVPGPPLQAPPPLPPLPIPDREGEDVDLAAAAGVTVDVSTVRAPGHAEPVVVEKRTLPGETKPSSVVVRTRTRTSYMDVVRAAGPDGPITGFKVVAVEEVEG